MIMKKAVLSGYFGFDNFGDEKVLGVLVETLKSIDFDITVFSKNPVKTAEIYKVKSVNYFNPFLLVREIFFSDALISGGGSLLQDATSVRSLFYYLGVIFLGLLFRKKVILYSQGIGPINSKVGWIVTKFLLKRASLVMVRDEGSYCILQKAGIDCVLTADALWSQNFKETEKKSQITVQLRDWPSLDKIKIQEMADVISREFPNLTVKILPMQMSLDVNVCRKLHQELKLRDIESELCLNPSNDDIIRIISESSYVIAMRYHACLCAIKTGARILALAYDIKVENMARQANVPIISLDIIDSGFVNAVEYMKAYSQQESSFFCLKEVTKSRQNNELLCKMLSSN